MSDLIPDRPSLISYSNCKISAPKLQEKQMKGNSVHPSERQLSTTFPIHFEHGMACQQKTRLKKFQGELDGHEKFHYSLVRQQLKASSRTSALLAGFAMVALVELQYESTTPHVLLILLSIVTTLLVSVHLLALMISTCLLPYIEASGCSEDSPHKRLKFYINLAWIFSTCIGLILFLLEIAIILFIKFEAVNYLPAAYLAGAILIPVFILFFLFSCLIHRDRTTHSINRAEMKMASFKDKYARDEDYENGKSIGKNFTTVKCAGQPYDI
uniref:MARVEL domain-containing protein n=1 Tax=Rhabditophanes sp. KR3021 TaxID=114890 RepID=A0AC35U5U9_9BILA